MGRQVILTRRISCAYDAVELEEQICVLYERKLAPARIARELNVDVGQVIDILHSLYHSHAE